MCREEKKRIPLAGVEDVWLPRPSSLALLTWRARSRGITFRKEKLFSFSVSSFLAQAAPRHLGDGTLLQQPGARRPRAGRACHGPPTKLIVKGGVGRKTDETESQGGVLTDETERQGRRVMSKRCQCRRKRMGCSRRRRERSCHSGADGEGSGGDAAGEDANEPGLRRMEAWYYASPILWRSVPEGAPGPGLTKRVIEPCRCRKKQRGNAAGGDANDPVQAVW